jgi:hypothetical protein
MQSESPLKKKDLMNVYGKGECNVEGNSGKEEDTDEEESELTMKKIC